MFDRLQKPFLTVETGEAYQPVRLTYEAQQADKFIEAIERLECIQKNTSPNSWSWYWKGECEDQHFDSVESYKKNPDLPVRLATITMRDGKVFMSMPSFKRACLAVPFFNRMIPGQEILKIRTADFINKVFALDERLPHGFAELFKDDELDRILNQRVSDYHMVKERCEQADSAENAVKILSEYTRAEAKKRLPYAERYVFEMEGVNDVEVVFLAFYIYLRGRELVAIKRWFGQTGYSLADAADETIAKVFGDMGLDIIE
jgi:hypothetical protein